MNPNRRIIIADCGSTTTEWALVEREPGAPAWVKLHKTIGLNPLYTTAEVMQSVLAEVVKELGPSVDAIYFYGAGCSGERIKNVQAALSQAFSIASSRVEVYSDLLGACRALIGPEGNGCACILGTGAIAALYDGKTDRMTTAPSLGYILGDEGSGGYIGRRLLSDYLKGQMPERVKCAFEEDFGVITPESAIEQTYQRAFPNRYLASFAPFAGRHLEHPYVQQLVYSSFEAFFKRNVMRLSLPKGSKVSMVGSVAWYMRDLLQIVAASFDLELGQVMCSPMEGLVKYHRER